MIRKSNKPPYVKGIRLDSPLGLLGVPPEFNYCLKTVIIVTDESRALKMLKAVSEEHEHLSQ